MVSQTTSAFIFRLYCPHASHVAVVGEFNCWCPTATPMTRTRGGYWEARLQLKPGEYRFRYLVDGSQWLTDYSCGRVVPNAHASWDSLAVVKPWTDLPVRAARHRRRTRELATSQ